MNDLFIGIGVIVWLGSSLTIRHFLDLENSDPKTSIWSVLFMRYSRIDPFTRYLSLGQAVGLFWIIAGFFLGVFQLMFPVSSVVSFISLLVIFFGPLFIVVYMLNSKRFNGQ